MKKKKTLEKMIFRRYLLKPMLKYLLDINNQIRVIFTETYGQITFGPGMFHWGYCKTLYLIVHLHSCYSVSGERYRTKGPLVYKYTHMTSACAIVICTGRIQAATALSWYVVKLSF